MSGILIVDDNQSIRHLLRSFVENKTKFPVCGEAANGMEAIEQATQLQPDLVLLDLSMPNMSDAMETRIFVITFRCLGHLTVT